jgi:hypothetical protein
MPRRSLSTGFFPALCCKEGAGQGGEGSRPESVIGGLDSSIEAIAPIVSIDSIVSIVSIVPIGFVASMISIKLYKER